MTNRRRLVILSSGLTVGVAGVAALLFPDFRSVMANIMSSENTYSTALRLSVPLVMAGLGGLLAEKSGVINIGLEGFLIIGAFTPIFVIDFMGGSGTVAFLPIKWFGVLMAALVTTVFALLFAVICIRYKADQIIAGLAIWLLALGLGPFLAIIYWGGPNSGQSFGTISNWTIPVLSEIPFLGPVLFDASPFVYIMTISVALVWILLNRTKYGRWIRASGENPEALDTVGINVYRVRYGSVLLSGFLSGIGGAGLSIGQVGLFIGAGQTMVNGRGFIAITTYLLGNYNPIGTFGASLIFGGLNAIQIRLQSVPAYDIPDQVIRSIPFIVVIIVLVLFGRTRLPSAAGESYELGEEE